MTTSPTPHPIRKAPLFTPYVLLWTTVGALSLGTLMVVGLAPEWLDDLRPASIMTDPQSNQGQRAAARIAADLNALKGSVAQIQLDLSKVKTDVAAQSEQQRTVSAQVAALQTRAGTDQAVAKTDAAQPIATAPVEQAAAPAATPAPEANAAIDTSAIAKTAPAIQVSAPAASPAAPKAGAPARTPKVINAEATALGLETGSVSAPAATADAISFGPAVVKPAPQPVGVKISSGASVDSLRLSWSLLAEQHGDALKSLEARYTAAGDAANPSYDLVAGPIKSKAQAAKVCKALTAKGVACTVGAFAGDAL
ncbi:MAG: SPOR domain-containing protein [Hyphomicrobium sp.]|nr:SPOR domain-containing protein [Hyphomicrobium sp.]